MLVPHAGSVAAFICLASAAAAAPSPQATAERASFIVRLGVDTIAIETFSRTANRLEGEVLMRPGLTRSVHYAADVLAGQGIRSMELRATSHGWRPMGWTTASVRISGDSVTTSLTRANGGPISFTEPVGSRAMPMPILSYAIFEAAIRQARATGEREPKIDAVWFPRTGPGGIETMTITEPTPRHMLIHWNTAPVKHRAEIADDGRLLRFDGLLSTVAVEVERTAPIDLGIVGARWSAADSGGRKVASFSVADSARGTAGATGISIVYHAPTKRGRKIFGGLVPYDSVWRTGANEATVLTTSAALTVEGRILPAGSYSLWTIPQKNGATLIINGESGQWGTNYDRSRDVMRVRAVASTLSEPVERFTFRVEPLDGGRARLLWKWDTTQYAVMLTAK